MPEFSQLPLGVAVGVFLCAGAVITWAGTRIARLANTLADTTGWGEAIFGAVLLGASTSIPGIVTSVSAAASGHAQLAFNNAIGGIAAQTVFLVIADVFHRRANLEHSAASLSNMMQGVLVIILLSLVLIFIEIPRFVMFRIHPGSVGLILAYVYGIRIVRQSEGSPAWRARSTPETVVDRPEACNLRGRINERGLWLGFAACALVLAVAGHVVAGAGVAIARGSGISESIVGVLFTALATSMPELVTSVAAVRQGALTLAVGNIIGGNSFEILFLPFADAAYREGSIYHAVGNKEVFFVGLSMLLVAILLLGLLRREKSGIANIGFESFSILLCYVAGVTALCCMS